MNINGKRITDTSLFKVDNPPPFDTMGLFTFLRTYARRHDESNPKSTVESWQETIERVVTASNVQLNVGFTEEEQKELFSLLYNLKCSVAGRFLWQLGTRTVDKLGLTSLQNCAFSVIDSPIQPFTWAMNMLMLGCTYPDAPVLTEKGIVKIKDIRKGDKVWSYNQDLEQYEYKDVLYVHDVHVPKTENIRIKAVKGSVIVSKSHPLLVYREKKWEYIQAGTIKIGDVLKRFTIPDPDNYCFRKNIFDNGLCKETGLIPESIKVCYDKNIFVSFLCGLFNKKCTMENITYNCHSENLLDELCLYCPMYNIFPKKTSDLQLTFNIDEFWEYLDFFHCFSSVEITEYKNNRSYFYPIQYDRDYGNTNTYDKVIGMETNLDITEDFKDITVEGNSSYYTGETSFYVSHNCGVGYRILPEDIKELPVIKYAMITRKDTKDADFIVPDSREGWVKLLGKVLKAHFYSGENFTYSCTLLRSKGAPIKSFGGLASGPEVLCDGMEKISNLLNKKVGQKMSPTDALDIMNIIGMVVVSGNVRRSAQIAIGDCKDKEYLNAKDWSKGNIPNWRAFSNNSVVCNDINEIIDNSEFWKGYEGNGEPYGLINLKLSQSCGRLGETQYSDPDVAGYNPCAEQSLSDKEVCCLSELYLPNISSKEELFKCSTFLYKICKHSLVLPCRDSRETERIVHKNMRIGIGVTGYMQATEEQKAWLPDCYKYVRELDKNYSRMKGFPVSVKLTTCKPSGTLSILGGCTPGVHPGFSQYYKRRIRIASESPLINIAKKHGYPVEYVQNFDGTLDHTTQIITFPHRLPEGTILAENCTAVEQMEWVKRLQTDWSDNSVSVTVYYRKNELPSIKEWLRKNYNNNVKSISFLLHSDHGFLQAPMEQITKEEYEKLASMCQPIRDLSGICWTDESIEDLESECAGGACPRR
jgi:ribonucleoside-triphosphate reductase (thioredoxin)